MTRPKPFEQADIDERATWPQIQAALIGPEAYESLGILSPKQRGELVRLARVEPERKKPFIIEVTGAINFYRRRHAQESPAAVAESMRRLINMVVTYARDVGKMPLYVICELKPPLPAADWFEHAQEMLRRKERLVKGNRPQRITQALLFHAWVLQKVAGKYSSHLASDWEEMKHWLGEALIASGEPPPGKNGKTAYYEQLMLPRAADGSVDLSGAPKQLAPVNPDKGT